MPLARSDLEKGSGFVDAKPPYYNDRSLIYLVSRVFFVPFIEKPFVNIYYRYLRLFYWSRTQIREVSESTIITYCRFLN